MSESGSTQLPPKIPQPTAASSRKSDSAVRARIEKTANGDIHTIKRPTKLEGRVVDTQSDGTTRIRTARGDVTVHLPKQQTQHIKEGDTVEIEIRNGSKGRDTHITPKQATPDRATSSSFSPQTTETQAPNQTDKSVKADQPSPPPKPDSQYIAPDNSVKINEENMYLKADAAQKIRQPITEKAIVRFIPLSDQDVERYLQRPAQTETPRYQNLLHAVTKTGGQPASDTTAEALPKTTAQRTLTNTLTIATTQLALTALAGKGGIPQLTTVPYPSAPLQQNGAQTNTQKGTTAQHTLTTTGSTRHTIAAQQTPAGFPLYTGTTAQPVLQQNAPALVSAAPQASPALQSSLITATAHTATTNSAPVAFTAPQTTASQPQSSTLFQRARLPTAAQIPATLTATPVTQNAPLVSTTQSVSQHAAFTENKSFDAQITRIDNTQITFQPLTAGPQTAAFQPTVPNAADGTPRHFEWPAAQQKHPVTNAHHPAQTKTAHIVGRTQNNLPIISFQQPSPALSAFHPEGLYLPYNVESQTFYALQFPADNLPLGAQIELAQQNSATTSAGHAGAVNNPAGITQPPTLMQLANFQWPALEELNQLLQQNTLAAHVTQHMAQVTPNPSTPARLPAAALLMIAVIRSGDLSGWLGDKTIESLKTAGKSDLLSRLTRDIGSTGRLSTDQTAPDWKTIPLPFHAEGDLQHIMLHYKQEHGGDNDDDETEDKNKMTRFIFDLSLNRMGPVQIDGYHRMIKQDKAKLDLIVRTQKPLSAPMQQRMRQTYTNALEVVGAAGELSFQGKADQFIQFDGHAPVQRGGYSG